MPLGCNGTRFIVGSNYTLTTPGFILEPLYVKGRSLFLYSTLMHPIMRSRTRNLYLSATFNFQNVMSTILDQLFYNDLIRSLRLAANYDMVDRWNGADALNIAMENGYNILGAQNHVNKSRFMGVPDFTKFNFYASRLKSFNSRFSLLVAFQGQYACNPLLSSEQFGFGGPDFGRGYDPSEIIGDTGVASKVEFRLDTYPEKRFLNLIQWYVFYDAGVVWNRDNTTQIARQSATSLGGGARIIFLPQITANLLVAKPLSHNVATLAALGTDPQQARGFFQIAASF